MNNLFIFSSKFKYPNPRPKISEPEPKIPEPDSKCRNTPTGSIPNTFILKYPIQARTCIRTLTPMIYDYLYLF